MSHESVKAVFSDSVNHIASNISLYVVDPGKDLTRNRKMGPANLISFMVSCGSSSTRLELLDFFDMDPNAPSASAYNQQRVKLKPDALEAVFHQFNSSVMAMEKTLPVVSLLPTVPPLLFSANLLFPLRNTLFLKDIQPKGFIVCI
ncbi:hypothetical protein [Hungatella hathewayi]|uniref:hypothetical protein n=1 Tax=Hungatella hathewayi TaxID=154046 RepID=UPI003566CB9B